MPELPAWWRRNSLCHLRFLPGGEGLGHLADLGTLAAGAQCVPTVWDAPGSLPWALCHLDPAGLGCAKQDTMDIAGRGDLEV